MSSIALKRVIMDISDYMKEPIENTYIHFDESNMFELYLLIIGPDNTPYENGFYFFQVKFPNDYPYKHPDVKYMTTMKGVRFNPNLYENGKVCLSILGTWSGPEWTSVMNLKSLILSLQSLLNEHPLRNEPGFDKEKVTSDRNIAYNDIIRYYNYGFSIIEMIKKCAVPQMQEIVDKHYKDNEKIYKCKLRELQELEKPKTVKTIYGMHCLIDYKTLTLV